MTRHQRRLLEIAVNDGERGLVICRAIDAAPLVNRGWLTPSGANKVKDVWRITKQGRRAYAATVQR